MSIPSITLQMEGSPDGCVYIYRFERSFTIGARSENDIEIKSTHSILVSAYHAQVIHKDHSWYITDDKSKNGTFVNGDKLTDRDPHPIVEDDTIRCAKVAIRVLKISTSHPASPAAASPHEPTDEALPNLMARHEALQREHRRLQRTVEDMIATHGEMLFLQNEVYHLKRERSRRSANAVDPATAADVVARPAVEVPGPSAPEDRTSGIERTLQALKHSVDELLSTYGALNGRNSPCLTADSRLQELDMLTKDLTPLTQALRDVNALRSNMEALKARITRLREQAVHAGWPEDVRAALSALTTSDGG